MCILVVEDEPLIRFMSARHFSDEGFAVMEAEDGDRAVALIDANPDRFSALVTDVHMPGKLDGIDVAARFRARYPECPTVVTTARADVLSARPTIRRIVDVVLEKPYELSKLTAALRRLVEQDSVERPC